MKIIHHEQTEFDFKRERVETKPEQDPDFSIFNRESEKIRVQLAQKRLNHHIKIAIAKGNSANRKSRIDQKIEHKKKKQKI